MALIYLAFISLGLPDSLLGAAWPAMHPNLAAGLDSAGLVSVVVACGTVVSSLISERLIRRFGTGVVTAVSVAATAGALLGSAFTAAVWQLMLLAVPLGLGAGAVDAALNNYVALHYKPRHMSWLHCFWGVGAFAGPLILGVCLSVGGGWRGGYLSIGGIQAVVCALLFASLPLWKRMNAGGLHGAKTTGAQTAPDKGLLRRPGVPAAMLTFACYCAVEFTASLWGASYLVEVRGFDEAGAASAVSLFFLGITCGRFLSGFLTVKLSGRQLIRAGILILCAGVALLALPLPPAMGPVALLVIGLGCAPIFPSMIHETPARFGGHNSQRIIGWQMASAYFGNVLVPPLVGLAANRLGMWVCPATLALGGVLMLLLSERINRVAGAAHPTKHTEVNA